MIKTITTPNSTTPIISADQSADRVLTIAVASLALVLAAAGGVEVYGALAAQSGQRAFARAVALTRGAERDDALHIAQRDLGVSVRLSSADPAVWLALAETRYLQAVAAAAEGVSPELALAAARAASQAQALAPRDPHPPALLARALAAAGESPEAIAPPLVASYALDADKSDFAAWRPAVAFQAWSALPRSVQDMALTEACFYSRDTPERFSALERAAVVAADPDLAARLEALLTDAACQPALVLSPKALP